jgi:hypothetical protein
MKSVASLALSAFLLGISPFVAAAETVPVRPADMRINLQNNMPVVGDFTVGPARVFLEIPPGEERTVELQLTNREGRLSTYDFVTEDFDADPNREGTPIFYANEQEGLYTARTWITPEVRRLDLLHAERAFIRVTVKVPKDADAGDHQAALVVTRETATTTQGGFQIVPRVAALFIITVPGDIVQEGYITRLQPRHYVNWSLPVTLNLAARNTGTVHMDPVGTIVIRNIFGITVDEIPVKDWYILRDSSRQRDFQWKPLFGLGYYKATTDLQVFDRRPLEPVSAGFWIIPLLPVLILLFLIFLVSFLVQYVSARYEITRRPAGKAKKAK